MIIYPFKKSGRSNGGNRMMGSQKIMNLVMIEIQKIKWIKLRTLKLRKNSNMMREN